MKGTTKRQKEILEYISQYTNDYGYSPSYREIKERFNFSSLGSVYKHLHALKRKGLIDNEKHCSRSLRVTDDALKSSAATTAVEVPFIGHFSAGSPIETFSSISTISVPEMLVSSTEHSYIFQVRGDNLSHDQINDSDLLIVEANPHPEPGDLIMAMIHNHETVIKRYYTEGMYIRLEAPHSSAYPITIHQEEVSIQGKVIGLLRMY
ncbi:MAG: transcriptional repressor LexA [Chlamydiota bacterium]